MIIESNDLKSNLMNALLLDRKKIANKPNVVRAERDCHSISKCTFCHHYQMQTGSFGQCQLLSAPVMGAWKSCSLGTPIFAQTRE